MTSSQLDASQLVMLAVAGVLGVGLFLLALRRPAYGCAVLAIGIPLTGGLTRGAAIPLLRISEALTLVVVVALIVHMLPVRARRRFTILDIILLAYCLGSVLIPTAVIFVGALSTDLNGWREIVSPLQYLAMYLLFSRAEMSERDRRLVLNLAMLASLPMTAVAVLQYTDFAGARALIANYYPSTVQGSAAGVYRPTGLMGHYSALGAYGLINFTIALALGAVRHPGNRWPWLALVACANLITLAAAQTYAPFVALPVVIVAVVVYARRVPWRVLLPAPIMAVPLTIVLWSSITKRLQEQILGGGSNNIDSISTRVDYWQGFFIPAYLHHGFWMGTGTLMPPEVPQPLYTAVDNGYLYQLFRAGIPGMALLLVMMGGIFVAGWQCRRSPDPSRRALGAVGMATIVAVALVDWTSEYLTFTTVSQEFWMLIGMMAASAGAGAVVPQPAFVELRAGPGVALRARRVVAAAGTRLLGARRGLVGSSALLIAGTSAARLVSLAFSIAAARLLSPTGYGQLAYALVVANVASVLLINAPTGLTRYLARHRGNRRIQEAYLSNWVVAIAAVVVVSMAVAAPIAPLLGLHGGMVLGTLATIFGLGVMQTYVQIQTGLEHFARMSAFWLSANIIQLIAVLDAALFGFRSPEVFLTCYGLSGVLALVVFQLLDPLGLRVSLRAISRERMKVVWRYTLPLLFANAFVTVWLGCDMALVERMLPARDGGVYASAKTLAQALALAPQAIATAVLPGVSGLAGSEIAPFLKRAIALILAVQVPAVLLIALVGSWLAGLVFGGDYARAGEVLPLVATGMGLYGVFSVVESAWLGLGRTMASTIAAFLGMACTLGLGLTLVPAIGARGAAVAFAAGGVVAVAVLLGRVVWALGGSGPSRDVGHIEDGPGRAHSPAVRS